MVLLRCRRLGSPLAFKRVLSIRGSAVRIDIRIRLLRVGLCGQDLPWRAHHALKHGTPEPGRDSIHFSRFLSQIVRLFVGSVHVALGNSPGMAKFEHRSLVERRLQRFVDDACPSMVLEPRFCRRNYPER
jgi:hypothetical protein